jgi:hypothetical protein
MKTQELAVIAIHPDPSNPLGLDLRDILSALGGKLEGWTWCVRDLDWLGEGGEPFCRSVEEAGPHGLWLDSDELVRAVRGIYQTIEGRFLAFRRSTRRQDLAAADLDLSAFPSSRSVLAIVAVDGSFFDVYSKDPEATRLLRDNFPGARDECPERYF